MNHHPRSIHNFILNSILLFISLLTLHGLMGQSPSWPLSGAFGSQNEQPQIGRSGATTAQLWLPTQRGYYYRLESSTDLLEWFPTPSAQIYGLGQTIAYTIDGLPMAASGPYPSVPPAYTTSVYFVLEKTGTTHRALYRTAQGWFTGANISLPSGFPQSWTGIVPTGSNLTFPTANPYFISFVTANLPALNTVEWPLSVNGGGDYFNGAITYIAANSVVSSVTGLNPHAATALTSDDPTFYRFQVSPVDTDSDSLPDWQEYLDGTNFVKFDTDSDGLPDFYEKQHGFNPLDSTGINGGAGDADGDGLSNQNEYFWTTDPLNPNSDGDGSNDGAEVNAATHPTNPLNPGNTPSAPVPNTIPAGEEQRIFSLVPLSPDTIVTGTTIFMGLDSDSRVWRKSDVNKASIPVTVSMRPGNRYRLILISQDTPPRSIRFSTPSVIKLSNGTRWTGVTEGYEGQVYVGVSTGPSVVKDYRIYSTETKVTDAAPP